MNLSKLEYDNLRFEKYRDIEYTTSIDENTFAPIVVIRYPNNKIEEIRMTRIDIELGVSKNPNFVEAIIDAVILKKIRKLKIDKLNETSNLH